VLQRLTSSLTRQALVVVALALIVYWPLLGHAGLTDSEGHRAIPGWRMLDTGEFLVTHLFEHPYLRKPPGMPWAVAISSALLGQTEFAARAVSALASTLAALLALVFAARWFGRAHALWAGAAFVLMPLTWAPARAAEIEALNHLFTLAAACLVLDFFLRPAGARLMRASLLALATLGLLLAKGPASLPVLAGAIAAGLIVTRSPRALAMIAPALSAAGLVAGVLAWTIAQRVLGQDAVTQSPAEFLWSLARVPSIAVFAPLALLSALPAALALAFPFGPDARAEAAQSEESRRVTDAARALALTVLLAVGAYTLLGVSNPRYAMPALMLAPIGMAYLRWGAAAGAMRPLRARLARWALLDPSRGIGLPMLALLAAGSGVFVFMTDAQKVRSSGRDVGLSLAEDLRPAGEPRRVTIWADGLIEARPEIFWYAQREARRLGYELRVRWSPAWRELPPDGALLALRTDDRGNELGVLTRLGSEAAAGAGAAGAADEASIAPLRARPGPTSFRQWSFEILRPPPRPASPDASPPASEDEPAEQPTPPAENPS
jgi:4-amino-4-deoxy-L-arabinose transferase-like glycosyltransferase